MSLNLTGTSYILTTDDLLAVADERLIIEAADDSRLPDTSARSFDELQANATTGGAGSDAEKVRDQVLSTLSSVVKDAEDEVNGYAQGIYRIPLNPVDPFVKSLTRDWAWHNLRRRRNMYHSEDDKLAAERQLINRAIRIANEDVTLTATVLPQGEGSEEMIYDYGSADRTAYRDPVPPVYGFRKI